MQFPAKVRISERITKCLHMSYAWLHELIRICLFLAIMTPLQEIATFISLGPPQALPPGVATKAQQWE
jgi:hypothetical protein